MEDAKLPPRIAPLRNVAGLIGLIAQVQDREFGLPGMATFYGPSGFGKTTAVTVAANEFRAYSVQVKSVWSPTHLCQMILKELGVTPTKTIPQMVDQIGAQLAMTDRPLIIDDAQYLKAKRMIDLVRDIYESSQSTIILVGEEQLPAALTNWENVHNRMLAWLPALPCDLRDAQHLTAIYSRDVDIAEDLLRAIVAASAGSTRRVATNLSRAREIALGEGRSGIDLAGWGERAFETGQPPAPRTTLGAPRRAPVAPPRPAKAKLRAAK